jgi:hypothetical protein
LQMNWFTTIREMCCIAVYTENINILYTSLCKQNMLCSWLFIVDNQLWLYTMMLLSSLLMSFGYVYISVYM